MNRKGFAITTVVYGLALLGIMIVTMLMGILSTTRNNVSRESERIENVLINYNLASKIYKNSSDTQYFTVPKGETGWYRIEAFGASGKTPDAEPKPPQFTGNSDEDQAERERYKAEMAAEDAKSYGEGAYTTGIIYLKEYEKLALRIPAAAATDTSTYIYYDSVTSNNKLMVAAGGSNTTPGGTLGVQSKRAAGAEVTRETSVLKSGNLTGTENVTYGVSGKTSYMRGYPGSEGKISIASGQEYYFVDGLMIPAVNKGNGSVIIQRIREDEDFYSAQTDASLTLKPPIERIPRTNKKLNKVTKLSIKVNNPSLTIKSVHYSVAGADIPKSCGSKGCDITMSSSNIDDISIFFNEMKVVMSGVTVEVTNPDGVQTIYNSNGDANGKGLLSTPTGIKISAYQPDTTSAITPHGNYYMIPVTAENLAVASSQEDSSPISAERLNGEARQRWAIDLISLPNKDKGEPNFINIKNASGMPEYRIIDLARAKSLDVYRDENRNNGTISARQTFNALSRNNPQIWNIRNMSDGTFAIKTVQESLESGQRSGYLYVNTTKDSDNRDKLIIGAASDKDANGKTPESDLSMMPTEVERFILYSVDFATSTS